MAAQDRIIGGGFLIIGVAIVLVLLYFFTWGGSGGKEAFDQIMDEIFPAYEAAVREGDYLAVKNNAQKLLDAMEEGGAATVRKHIAAEAASSRGAVQRLKTLLRDKAFEKNAEALYRYGESWYAARTHRAFGQLEEAVDTRFKVLRSIRETAREARKALEEARMGSKLPLALPPAKGIARDDVPIVEPNPVYEHDQELYRVFGLDAKLLEEALNLPDPRGKATSARLRWNRDIATSDLRDEVAAIPERADSLNSIATQIDLATKALSQDPAAAKALEALLGRGVRMLGSGLSGAHAAAYRENADAFAKGLSLSRALRSEAKMLAPYLTTVRVLGAAFGKSFVK